MRAQIDNSSKIILDLCGGTGSWSKPYKDAGYDVRLITLPDYDVCTYVPPENVYGILAAPPCTEFSLAKTTAPRNLEYGMRVAEACMKIIWQCRLNKKLEFWALENPRGLLRQFLGKPHFTFYSWEYGGQFVKPTDLWGFYNIPKKTVFKRPEGITKQFPNGSFNAVRWNTPTRPEEYRHLKLSKQDIRAITPAGFAQAFFKANP